MGTVIAAAGEGRYSPAQELFMGVSGLMALTIVVLATVLFMYWRSPKVVLWGAGLFFLAVIPAGFLLHWAIGWLLILLLILGAGAAHATIKGHFK